MLNSKLGWLAISMAATSFQGCMDAGTTEKGGEENRMGAYSALTIPNNWNTGDGVGRDISISPQADIYKVDMNSSWGSYSLSQKTGSSWNAITGAAMKVSAGPSGELWAVAANDEIWRRSGGSWGSGPVGYGKDVAIGANGDVYKVDVTPSWGTYTLSKWTGSGWTSITGAAKKIVVAPNGTLWAIAKDNEIWSYTGGSWTQRPSTAQELAVDANGTVFKLGTSYDNTNEGYPVYKWNGSDWNLVSGYFYKIAGSTPTGLWGVAKDNTIWYCSNP
jgi:hypothetical protein